MKSILVSTVFLLSLSYVFSLPPVDFPTGQAPPDPCTTLNQHHYSPEKIAKLKSGQPLETTDTESGQHVLCIMRSKNLVSADGIINRDALKNVLSKMPGEKPEDIQKGLDCLVQKNDAVQTAIAFYNCALPFIMKSVRS